MGGIAVVATALIIAVVAVAAMKWVGSGEETVAGGTDEVDSGTDEVDGGTDEVDDIPGANAYTVREDICVTVDLTPAEDLSGTAHTLYDNGYESFSIWNASCKYSMRNDDVWGSLDLRINVYPDDEAAEQEFDRSLEVRRDFFDGVEDAPGPWQRGRTFIKDDSDEFVGSFTVLTEIVDGNLAVEVRFHGITDPEVDLGSEMQTMVEEMIVNVMTAHAA